MNCYQSLPKIQILFILIAVLVSFTAIGQTALTAENFDEEILKYEPIKHSGITEKEFNFASMVIRETKLAIKGDPDGLNRADYFNLLVAFLSLDESEQNIQLAFEKFSNSEGACEYFSSKRLKKSVDENETYAPIKAQFNAGAAECASGAVSKGSFNLANYCSANNLNRKLVALMHSMDMKDQQHRGEDYDNHIADQKVLDIANQFTIDSLYEVHGIYIGESLVGPKFESTMWAVIQHSNPEMMEKYLPVLKRAVEDGDIGEAALKMTIDRYYTLTQGFQVFGSQAGFGAQLADDEVRKRIAKEYGVKQ